VRILVLGLAVSMPIAPSRVTFRNATVMLVSLEIPIVQVDEIHLLSYLSTSKFYSKLAFFFHKFHFYFFQDV